MGVQTVLVPKVEVDFSPDLFCRFLRCSGCGVYIYRVDNKLGLYIGEVVSYTFLKGKAFCLGCYRG